MTRPIRPADYYRLEGEPIAREVVLTHNAFRGMVRTPTPGEDAAEWSDDGRDPRWGAVARLALIVGGSAAWIAIAVFVLRALGVEAPNAD